MPKAKRMIDEEIKAARNGCYYYDGKVYFLREDAFDDMLRNRKYDGKLKFLFNDHIFSKLDWTVEPDVSLDILYKNRAQQIRDKYKYLILGFSGGSDSTQILETFLKNNIFIDEIQTACNVKMSRGIDQNLLMSDPDLNLFLEYDLAVEPMLKKVKDISPNTKITIIDVSDFLHNEIKNKTYKFLSIGTDKEKGLSQRLTSTMGISIAQYYLYKQMNIFQSNDKDGVAIVRGIEKPQLSLVDKNLMFHFNDLSLISISQMFAGTLDPTYTMEDFFWSPDAPLIPIKQSHLIKKCLESNANFLSFFLNQKSEYNNFYENKNKEIGLTKPKAIMLERSYNSIIYPDWDTKTFVAPKSTTDIPELKLYSAVVGKHNTYGALEDNLKYVRSNWGKLTNSAQLLKNIQSRPYNLGKLSCLT